MFNSWKEAIEASEKQGSWFTIKGFIRGARAGFIINECYELRAPHDGIVTTDPLEGQDFDFCYTGDDEKTRYMYFVAE